LRAMGKKIRRKKRSSQNAAKRVHYSTLDQHRRQGKTLTPPLADLPNAQPASWMIFFYFAIGLVTISEWFLQKVNSVHLTESALLEEHQPKSSCVNDNKRVNLIIAIIFTLSLAPVLADLLPSARFQIERPELVADVVLLSNPACGEALVEQGIDSLMAFNRKYNPNQFSPDYGKLYFPLSIDVQTYNGIFKPPLDSMDGNEKFTSVFFLSQLNNYARQLIIPDNGTMDLIKSGSDAVIITHQQEETSFISMLALPDTNDNPLITEDVLTQSDMRCFFFPY